MTSTDPDLHPDQAAFFTRDDDPLNLLDGYPGVMPRSSDPILARLAFDAIEAAGAMAEERAMREAVERQRRKGVLDYRRAPHGSNTR